MTAVLNGDTGRRRRFPRLPPKLVRTFVGAAIVMGLLIWVIAAGVGGAKGAAVASILSLLVATALLVRSGLKAWLFTDSVTGDVTPHAHGVFLTDMAARATRTPVREAVVAVLLLSITVLIALMVGLVGDKAMLILIMTVGLLAVIVTVRNRSLMFMFVLAASFSFIWYKKFTPILSEHYATAIYITTFDVVLVFAYSVWAAEGTLFQDLRRGLKSPVFMLPIAGIAIALLSSVNAVDQRVVWAEIVRYLWMAALFVYCGIRIRRREHVWAIMLGWLVVLSFQVIVALSQYFTDGFLGIDQLRLRTDPMQPDNMDLLRPFGTQIHPTFLACLVGMICLMVSFFALHVPKDRLMRYVLLGCIPLSVIIAVVSRARASLGALAPAAALVLFIAVRRRLLSVRVMIVAGILGLIGVAAAAPQLTSFAKGMAGAESNLNANFKGRWQINEMAFRMVRAHPLVGVGINNFGLQRRSYRYEENKFDIAPAHNIYFLTAAETGMVGVGMLVFIGSVYGRYAYRLTLKEDPFYQAIGIGALGVLVFVAVEGFNSFTMKQDVPLATFWMIFGILIAADRMSNQDIPEMPTVRWFRPNRNLRPHAVETGVLLEGTDPAAGRQESTTRVCP